MCAGRKEEKLHWLSEGGGQKLENGIWVSGCLEMAVLTAVFQESEEKNSIKYVVSDIFEPCSQTSFPL